MACSNRRQNAAGVVRLVQVGDFVHHHLFGDAADSKIAFQWKYNQSPLPLNIN